MLTSDSLAACDSRGFFWIWKHHDGVRSINRTADFGISPEAIHRVNVLVNGGEFGYFERFAFTWYARYIFLLIGYIRVLGLMSRRQDILLLLSISRDRVKLVDGMKKICCVFVFLLTVMPDGAFCRVVNVDAFRACLNRTEHDRLSCQSGCGMILQQCYDEGVADFNKKINEIDSMIKAKNGAACASLAEDYLSAASRVANDVVQKANNLTGWIGGDLSLNFARQRLENLKLIQQSCKP